MFKTMNSTKCASCDAIDARTPCENCLTVYYCSKEHQKKDWNNHKVSCKLYKIQYSDKLGRFMVATRDIKPGEIILQETPTVVGLRTDSSIACLGCHRTLEKQNYKLCSNCGVAPVCSKECQFKPHHADRECSAYSKWFKTVGGGFLTSNMQLVTPLRCLLLRETNSWKNFMDLETHFHQRLNDSIWKFYQEKIFNILKSANIVDSHDQDVIQKICAILDINSFELRGPQTGERLRGIYTQAALMSHDCISNTHLSVDDNYAMCIRASVPIQAGAPVLFNYATPFESTTQRQQRLKQGKYFTCTCKRCSDPTELGTYMGSIMCSRCHTGFVIPTDPLSEQRDFHCNICNHKFDERLIKTTITIGWSMVEENDVTNYKKLENLLRKLLKTFPVQGVVVTELKQKLVACLRDVILRMANPSRNALKLQINLCEELLETLNTIEPGLSRLKGITLYELYKPKMILANKEFEGGEIKSQEFLNRLKDCEKTLKDAISILIYEPQDSPEGRLRQIALSEMRIIREEIKNVSILC